MQEKKWLNAKCETQMAYPSDNASVHIISHVLRQAGKTRPLLQ